MFAKIKKMILWSLCYLLDPAILWSFGWRRRVQTHKFNNMPILTYTVWEDPKNPGKYYKYKEAIKLCEERA